MPDKWLAVLNLVLAIGAQHSRIVGQPRHIHDLSNLIRFLRVRLQSERFRPGLISGPYASADYGAACPLLHDDWPH